MKHSDHIVSASLHRRSGVRWISCVALGLYVAFTGLPTPEADAGPPPPPPAKGGAGKSGAEAPPPPPPGAPSPEQVAAEDKYKQEKFESAAVAFQKAASGEAPGDRGRAQFWLGKTLYKLGFYAAAMSVFDEIVQTGPAHPYHQLTLPWLASLSRELPEGSGTLEKVGTYKPTDLENQAFDEVRDELYYLLGKFYYQKGDLGQTISLLSQVPEDSDFYIPSQFFVGVSQTREFKGPEAVEAFKNVLRKNAQLKAQAKKDKRKRKKKGTSRRARKDKAQAELSYEEELQRYEDRANMALGWIFYQVGKFETSLKYFDKIPLDSPYWLDSVFSSAWAEFRLVELNPDNANRNYQRTLGYIHTINAPFFEEYIYPEVMKLKAVTYYFNCRFDSAKRTVDEFNRRYPKVKEDLQSVLAKAPEDFQLYELSVKVRNEESGLDPFVEQLAKTSLQDKTLEKNYAYVSELEREIEQLESMSGDFKSSKVGERVAEDLNGAISLAKEATGLMARQRLTQQIKEIKDLEREMIKVEYEILEKRKQQKELEKVPPKPQKPKIDREHEIYNYNGEYWRDELGYYNYKVTSLCRE